MIYRRLTIRNCAHYAAVVFPVVTIISGLLFFSRLLADTAGKALPATLLNQLLLLTLLKYAPQVITLCIFAGCFIAMRQAFQRHEMDAWFSAGLGLPNFIRPILFFALPGAVFVGIFSLYGTPWAVSQIRVAQTTATINLNFDHLPQEQFIDIPGGIYTYFWDGNGDIFVARNDNSNHETIFTRSISKENSQTLELHDGRLYRLLADATNDITAETIKFDRIQLSLPVITNDRISLREKRTTQLDWSAPADRAELIWRLNLPIATIVLAILALLLAQSHPHFRGRHDYLSAIFIFFTYLNTLRYIKTLMEQGLSTPAALLLPPLLITLIVISVMAVFKRQ